MAITREKKKQMVAAYVDALSRSKAVFLTDYRGLSVSGLQELRAKVREVGGGHLVVKNTLVALALKEAHLPVPEEMLQGPVALSFVYEEIPSLAKVLRDFAKDTEIMEVKGGILDGELLSQSQVESLADMPPREVVMAQLLGLIQQPGNQVASIVNAVGSKLAATLKAYADQLQSSEAAA